MGKHLMSLTLIVIMGIVFSAAAFSQDAPKKEMKAGKAAKHEMKADPKEIAQGPLMEAACPPTCGFMVRSHSEKELGSMMKMHAKKMHKMDMTDAQCKEMCKKVDEGVK